MASKLAEHDYDQLPALYASTASPSPSAPYTAIPGLAAAREAGLTAAAAAATAGGGDPARASREASRYVAGLLAEACAAANAGQAMQVCPDVWPICGPSSR